ncbi:MAG: heavy-metal-associated domain-containing protein [Culturomica sp.]|jgi:copper chaperone CopZ|nr:heavy-metal-associated domain-containing protein [Culturomica sp.]
MKNLKLLLMLVTILMVSAPTFAQKASNTTVVYNALIDCAHCKAKIEKNIPYEKGVKDLKVDMEKQTVTVTFRSDKNTSANLRGALEKLQVPVSSYKEIKPEKSNSAAKE